MNIVQKLTLRHIKTHMKRSVLTALAIVVSVAMVTAVFTTLFSFLLYEHDATLLTAGPWHAQYMFDRAPDLDVFKNDPEIKSYTVGRPYLDIRLEDDGRWFGSVDAADASTKELRALNILEGAFPANSGELLISDKYLKDNGLDWKVGDAVELSVIPAPSDADEPAVTRTFRVCGVASKDASYFDNRVGAVGYDERIPVDEHTYVTVEFEKLDRTVFDKIDALQKKCGAVGVSQNRDLFMFSGIFRGSGMLPTLIAFVSVILSIIVIASVSMIYDSFAVSYQERERYLGMLASVGATKRQKRASVYFEGLILSLVSIPVGIAAGFAGMAVTFRVIQSQLLMMLSTRAGDEFRVRFSPWIILGAVLTAAFTVFVSCYIPARRASKTSPIDAIRGANTVKVKKAKKLRVPRLARKLWGYEGELAVKNFKRNGRRSRNIVFALVLSAVLFLSVTNFSTLLNELMKNEVGERQPDFTVGMSPADMETAEPILRNQIGADGVIGTAETYMYLTDPGHLTEKARELVELDSATNGVAGKRCTSVTLFAYDNESFDRYVRDLGGDPAEYHDKDRLKAVLYNVCRDPSTKRLSPYACFDDGVKGTVLHLDGGVDGANDAGESRFDVTVGIVTDREYSGGSFMPAHTIIPALVMPLDTYYEIASFEMGWVLYGVRAKNYEEVEKTAEELLHEAGVEGLNFYDNAANVKYMNATFDVLKVFIYGFITLITLIAVINIVNSVANSMNERRREFAMLRSVGLTPGGFKKMIWVESMRYGAKALLIALPLGFAINLLMFFLLFSNEDISISFAPNPLFYVSAVLGVAAIIAASLLYSADKLKDDGIIENLKEDI